MSSDASYEIRVEILKDRVAQLEVECAQERHAVASLRGQRAKLGATLAAAQNDAHASAARLAAVREWAEVASRGYDAGNYNLTATPQESCGLAVLAVLKARIEETTDE